MKPIQPKLVDCINLDGDIVGLAVKDMATRLAIFANEVEMVPGCIETGHVIGQTKPVANDGILQMKRDVSVTRAKPCSSVSYRRPVCAAGQVTPEGAGFDIPGKCPEILGGTVRRPAKAKVIGD